MRGPTHIQGGQPQCQVKLIRRSFTHFLNLDWNHLVRSARDTSLSGVSSAKSLSYRPAVIREK